MQSLAAKKNMESSPVGDTLTRKQHVCHTAGNNTMKNSATTLGGARPQFPAQRLTYKRPVTDSGSTDDVGGW